MNARRWDICGRDSALMLVCARLRHVAGTVLGTKRYMSMKHFETVDFMIENIAG